MSQHTDDSEHGPGASTLVAEYSRQKGQSMAVAIVEAITGVRAQNGGTGSEEADQPRDLPPLYDAIDTDALEALFRSDGPDSALSVEFTYLDYRVAVNGPDRIEVHVGDTGTDSTTPA